MRLDFVRRRWKTCAAVATLAIATGAYAQSEPPLDPESPMAPLPDLGVDWPDLGKVDAIEVDPDAPATPAIEIADDQRYAVVVTGIEKLSPVVASRFNELSILKEGAGKPANAAQIDRRARDDADLMNTILRAEGYYDANVDTDVVPKDGRLVVTLSVDPGPIYRFKDVNITGLDDAKFGVKPTDAVDADAVIADDAVLREKLSREGYPFAKVTEPEIVINHDSREAVLNMTVETGGKRNFGTIKVLGDDPPFGPKHVQTIARFQPGQVYDQTMVDDLRRALVATGLVSSVKLEPVEGSTPGTADIAATIEPAPPRTIAGELGYGTGEGFRVEASWQHRNLIRPEGAVTFRGVAGTKEQSLGALLRMGNFHRRDQILNGGIVASHKVYAAYDATSLNLNASLERQTNIIWQKDWIYSFGFELVASEEKDFVASAGVQQRRIYYIGALPISLGFDGSDSLLDPTRGFRLSARLSPEISQTDRTFGYVRAQIDGSAYYPVTAQVVIAGRARIGSTVGAAREDIAPSRRFYSGGGGSVRGFGYQEIGPRNVLDQPVGGRSLAEFSLEARVRLPVFGGNFGVVPFIDAGNIYTGSFPDFSGLRVGAGLGLRYYSAFGPIRIDVGTPLARRSGESAVSVQVSLGQAF